MADKFSNPYDQRKSLVVHWHHSQCLLTDSMHVGQVVTIDDLPDDALLEIFDFYVARYHTLVFRGSNDYYTKRKIESWQSLVHVCRRWRGLVFESPRRLNLRLCCKTGRPVKETLDVWPALPLIIYGSAFKMSADTVRDRICQIDLNCLGTALQFEQLWTEMQWQVPFPELAVLYLRGATFQFFWQVAVPVLPDSFLGGSAPRLRYLALTSIPFPGLPKFLLSATHLVDLHLHDIPHSGNISSETMVASLSVLTSLVTLRLEFEFPQLYPDRESRRPRPPARSVLPALEVFTYKGLNEYSEKLLAQIDAPRLYRLSTTFFDEIDFSAPELTQFITRTPEIGAYSEARLILHNREAQVRLQSPPAPFNHMVKVKTLCDGSNRQLSFLAQICTLSLRHLLTIENLYIHEDQISLFNRRDDIENAKWSDLLLPFTAVKNLYLSGPFSPRIAPTPQEQTGGKTTEVFPALQNILLEGFEPSEPVQEDIAQFISSRQLTNNHPVALSVWHRDLAWEEMYLET